MPCIDAKLNSPLAPAIGACITLQIGGVVDLNRAILLEGVSAPVAGFPTVTSSVTVSVDSVGDSSVLPSFDIEAIVDVPIEVSAGCYVLELAPPAAPFAQTCATPLKLLPATQTIIPTYPYAFGVGVITVGFSSTSGVTVAGIDSLAVPPITLSSDVLLDTVGDTSAVGDITITLFEQTVLPDPIDSAGYGSIDLLTPQLMSPDGLDSALYGDITITLFHQPVLLDPLYDGGVGDVSLFNSSQFVELETILPGDAGEITIQNSSQFVELETILPGDAGDIAVDATPVATLQQILPVGFTEAVVSPIHIYRFEIALVGANHAGYGDLDTLPKRSQYILQYHPMETLYGWDITLENEHRALSLTGLEPAFESFEPDDDDPWFATGLRLQHDPPEDQYIGVSGVPYPSQQPIIVDVEIVTGGGRSTVPTVVGYYQDLSITDSLDDKLHIAFSNTVQAIVLQSIAFSGIVSDLHEDISWFLPGGDSTTEVLELGDAEDPSANDFMVVGDICVRHSNHIALHGVAPVSYAPDYAHAVTYTPDNDCAGLAKWIETGRDKPVPSDSPLLKVVGDIRLSHFHQPVALASIKRPAYSPAIEDWYTSNGVDAASLVAIINGLIAAEKPIVSPLVEWRGMVGEWWFGAYDSPHDVTKEQCGFIHFYEYNPQPVGIPPPPVGGIQIRWDPGIIDLVGVAPPWKSGDWHNNSPRIRDPRETQAIFQDHAGIVPAMGAINLGATA